MKISIFGAKGRTGVEVVKYAKAQGFEIVESKGDILDYNNVLETIKNCDAVISVVGHIKGSDPLMQTKGMVNIVKAMESTGKKRLLSLTGTGARAEGDKPSTVDKVLNYIVAIVDPNRINDGIEHVKVLRSSNLDWTLVRVLKLGEGTERSDKYLLTEGGPAEILTSRKKVARILVDLINDKKYLHKLPVVSG
ncbi:MAG: SDR family oxidoreductase [Candidatus Doudnabacteria bacterium]